MLHREEQGRAGAAGARWVEGMKQFQSYIDGRFVAGKREFPDINPADGTTIAQAGEANGELVDAAVEAARRALRGEWGRMGVRERAAALYRVAEGIEKRFEEFVAAEVGDTGKPVALASRLDVPRGATNFRVFADLIKTAGVEAFQTEMADGREALNYAVRKPVGVVGIITPWNLPLLLLTWKTAPALACGNAVVVKPSEETPATATMLAEVMQEAGIPKGVFNLVHGFGPGSAGEFLTKHDGVNAITFTGESKTGAEIMKACAPRVRPVSFELGGKNAAIVFADCNFDETVNGLADAVFMNTGQVCLCAERVYVEQAAVRASGGRAEEKSRRTEGRLADGGDDDAGAVDLGAAPGESAVVLQVGAGGRRHGGDGGRRAGVRRCTRPRLLGATDDLHRAGGVGALREGGDLRAGVPREGVRYGR